MGICKCGSKEAPEEVVELTFWSESQEISSGGTLELSLGRRTVQVLNLSPFDLQVKISRDRICVGNKKGASDEFLLHHLARKVKLTYESNFTNLNLSCRPVMSAEEFSIAVDRYMQRNAAIPMSRDAAAELLRQKIVVE